MVIARDLYELKTLERRRQALKDKKWKEGHQSWADKKEEAKLNLDAAKTKSLRLWV